MHRDADMGAWRTIIVHQPLVWCGCWRGVFACLVWAESAESGERWRVPALATGAAAWAGATADMLPRTQPAPRPADGVMGSRRNITLLCNPVLSLYGSDVGEYSSPFPRQQTRDNVGKVCVRLVTAATTAPPPRISYDL